MKKIRSQRGEDEALLVGLIAFSRTRVAVGTPVRMIDLSSVVQKPSLRELADRIVDFVRRHGTE